MGLRIIIDRAAPTKPTAPVRPEKKKRRRRSTPTNQVAPVPYKRRKDIPAKRIHSLIDILIWLSLMLAVIIIAYAK